MRVMAVVVIHPATAAAATRHGHAALRTDLGVLCFHAGGDLHHVRNDVGAQPHRIGRAGLLHRGGDLGAGATHAAKKKCANRQRQPANKENGPHLVFPGVERFSRRGESSGCRVDGLSGKLGKTGGQRAVNFSFARQIRDLNADACR
jgi:hypothetical protein